jgi:hypothetical protein
MYEYYNMKRQIQNLTTGPIMDVVDRKYREENKVGC